MTGYEQEIIDLVKQVNEREAFFCQFLIGEISKEAHQAADGQFASTAARLADQVTCFFKIMEKHGAAVQTARGDYGLGISVALQRKSFHTDTDN